MRVDPNLKQPTATQSTAYLERQLTTDIGSRVGFVYYTVRNQTATFQPFRPATAYTTPFSVVDPGQDGRAGTPDDANLTFYGIPNSVIANFPNTSVVSNTANNGTYNTVDFALSKRLSHKYSAAASLPSARTRTKLSVRNVFIVSLPSALLEPGRSRCRAGHAGSTIRSFAGSSRGV